VLYGINCYDSKTCLTPQCYWQPLFQRVWGGQTVSNPSFQEAGRDCKCAISLLESKLARFAHMGSIEEKMTVAIKETIDFGWIRSSGCSIYGQIIVDGVVRCITRIAIPWWCKRTNRSVSEWVKQVGRGLQRGRWKILFHKWVSRKVLPLCFFRITSGVSINSLSAAHDVCCKHHDSCDITLCCHIDSWGPVWKTYISYYIDGSVCVAATNVSINKHYNWKKKRGIGSGICNCVTDVFVSNTHPSWQEKCTTFRHTCICRD
jgi:hypothetical protein